jgi:hypothetical protein
MFAVLETTITKSKKGTARPKLNKEQADCFFDVKDVVPCEFVFPNTTVNFCCDVLRGLRENVRREDRSFGVTTTSSIMTTRPLTRP